MASSPYDTFYLSPDSARRRSSTNRRSSASWTDGIGNMQRQLSTSSAYIAPTSQTSSSVHSVFGDSGFLQTTIAQTSPPESTSFQWLTQIPGEESTAASDNETLFPTATLVPTTPNPHDGGLNLDSPPSNPDFLFRVTIRWLEEQYNQQQDRAAYADNLARTHLDGETYRQIRSSMLLNLNLTIPSQSNPQSIRRRNSTIPPQYLCLLCTTPRHFSTRGSFKRHVIDQHRAKSLFLCGFCDWYNARRDKLVHHYQTKHSAHHQCGPQEISSREVTQPAPDHCDLCPSYDGSLLHVGPFTSWDDWFEGIEDHCRLGREEEALSAQDSTLPDQDGGGAGGTYDSSSLNWPGASPGGFSYFPASDWDPNSTGFDGAYSGPSTLGTQRTETAPGERFGCSQAKSSKTTPSTGRSNDDRTSADRDSQSSRRSLHIPRSPHLGKSSDEDRNKTGHGHYGSCEVCGHENRSCSACSKGNLNPGSCHMCQDRTARVFPTEMLIDVNAFIKEKRPSCSKGQDGGNYLPRLVIRVSQQLEPTLKPSRSSSSPHFAKPSCLRHEANVACPRPDVTLSLFACTVQGPDPVISLIISINRLSLNQTTPSPDMTQDCTSKTVVDALMVGQTTLSRMHSDPPGTHQKILQQLNRCAVSLDAIDVELGDSSSSFPESPSRLSRQKRLSCLLARLRAVTFVLTLQKEVTRSEILIEPSSDIVKDSQSRLFGSISKNLMLSPFINEQLGKVYQLFYYCQFYGNAWACTGLQGPKKAIDENPCDVMGFLRALATSLSDQRLSFLDSRCEQLI